MEFYDVLEKRKSVRQYSNVAIPQKSIDNIARAVQVAPSACNLQPWKVLLIFNKSIKEQIYKCYSADWLKDAPAIAVALGNDNIAWKRLEKTPITNIDLGIMMEHFILAATAENLATCWICAFEQEKIKKALNINNPWNVLAITPLGYAVDENNIPTRTKKDINDIFEIIK